MSTTSPARSGAPDRASRITEGDCDLDAFAALLQAETDLAQYPYADRAVRGVLFYGAAATEAAGDPVAREDLSDELARALSTGPGIVVFDGAFDERHGLRASTELFTAMIAEQRATGSGGGDHFAAPGANDRIWNALQKHALRDPASFARYYANDVLALVATAWLGPMYQVTSAINVVNPGGTAQSPHRDYHLGFMEPETAQRFPRHTHLLSPALTLQGAVAQVDMPVSSGPTLYLPYSQRYEPGYVAFTLPEFRDYFEANHVQLPLRAGDAVFFNPALFHAAGSNRSAGIRRMANLLQISSAFGRAMDAVDRSAILRSVYPELRALAGAGETRAVANLVAASAEGYAFPSNLDRDQPLDGMHGETQAELTRRALASGLAPEAYATELAALDERHRP
ncbi:phytanoyl-CoA dioxygenase family protein [Tsukamurella tyrosinosolvens]|uniref:phytanoyl-CoA dioxygenase family protein n=1 Tax=Tsukamurella tyrosinosolvens TaxID=57704 RepID=UPI001AF27459|nr:phytanoyl-CoA dioxygenase family protein [Tsukamurella tyrosinosolvens]QRY84095.1 phytanoyl-CoA dioxygenase family protein [Tsukamurella tyrosinosolvens]